MSAYVCGGVVTFSETDASGWSHYANALKWAEDAEHALYRSAGVPVASFPRRAVAASFERPLTDGDDYTVELEVDRLGTSSITYAWRVLTRGAVAVTGSHTVVHLGAAGRPEPVPEALRATLGDLLRAGV